MIPSIHANKRTGSHSCVVHFHILVHSIQIRESASENRPRSRIVGADKEEKQGFGENYILRSFIICNKQTYLE